MEVTRENLETTLHNDALAATATQAARKTGLHIHIAGSAVADALVGTTPTGLTIACDRDAGTMARALASATGMIPVPLKGSRGVVALLPRAFEVTDRRTIVVVPAGSGIDEHLLGAGFTVQAMAFDPDSGALVDPFGGESDLAAGRLKAVSPGGLYAQPSRVLTAVQLGARYRLEIEENTLQALKRAAPALGRVEPRLVWGALARLMRAPRPADTASTLRELGALAALLPEVADVFDVPQNYYHHLGVWGHTLEVMEHLEAMLDDPSSDFKVYGARIVAHMAVSVEGGVDRRAFLFFSALIHDIGKAATMTVTQSGRIRFQGHQEASARLADRISRRLSLGRRGRSQVVGLVGQHMRLGFLMKEGESAASRLRVVRDLGSRAVDVAVLSLADRLATRGEASTSEGVERYERVVRRVIADYFWDRDYPSLVRGGEVSVLARVPPGPEISQKLLDIRVAQREGLVSNWQQALEYVSPDFKGKMR